MREEIGLNNETIKTNSNTVSELYNEIKNIHNFSIDKKNLKIAINNYFAEWNEDIQDNDTVIFIPPVAGG